jgi:hypothetical protein
MYDDFDTQIQSDEYLAGDLENWEAYLDSLWEEPDYEGR